MYTCTRVCVLECVRVCLCVCAHACTKRGTYHVERILLKYNDVSAPIEASFEALKAFNQTIMDEMLMDQTDPGLRFQCTKIQRKTCFIRIVSTSRIPALHSV